MGVYKIFYLKNGFEANHFFKGADQYSAAVNDERPFEARLYSFRKKERIKINFIEVYQLD